MLYLGDPAAPRCMQRLHIMVRLVARPLRTTLHLHLRRSSHGSPHSSTSCSIMVKPWHTGFSCHEPMRAHWSVLQHTPLLPDLIVVIHSYHIQIIYAMRCKLMRRYYRRNKSLPYLYMHFGPYAYHAFLSLPLDQSTLYTRLYYKDHIAYPFYSTTIMHDQRTDQSISTNFIATDATHSRAGTVLLLFPHAPSTPVFPTTAHMQNLIGFLTSGTRTSHRPSCMSHYQMHSPLVEQRSVPSL